MIWASLPLGLIGGVVGAVLTDFLRGPFRQFFAQRTEIRHDLIMFGNTGAPDPRWVLPAYQQHDIDRLMRPFNEAQQALRRHAAWMRAFAETEPLPAWLVARFGYRPLDASLGLMGLSNTVVQERQERIPHRKLLNDALRLPD